MFCVYYSWAILRTHGAEIKTWSCFIFFLFVVVVVYNPTVSLVGDCQCTRSCKMERRKRCLFVNYRLCIQRLVHYLWTPFRIEKNIQSASSFVCVCFWRYDCTTCAKAIARFQLLATCYVYSIYQTLPCKFCFTCRKRKNPPPPKKKNMQTGNDVKKSEIRFIFLLLLRFDLDNPDVILIS